VTSPTDQPQTSIPTAQLVEAVRALARLSRVLERSAVELSLADYRLLVAVEAGEGRASRLAAKLALGKPAVSATVDSLCRRGLLTRSTVVGDNRAVALAVTPEGLALLEKAEAEMADRLRRLTCRTPDPAGVIAALGWLGDALEAVMAERDRTAEPAGDPQ
jgi:DNA-binding MarR family transcriptional regulator